MSHCITSEEAKELVGWDEASDIRTIYAVLQHLTDTCRSQGKRSSLAQILTFVL